LGPEKNLFVNYPIYLPLGVKNISYKHNKHPSSFKESIEISITDIENSPAVIPLYKLYMYYSQTCFKI